MAKQANKDGIFEVLLETQSKSVENLGETSKKAQELIASGASVEKTVELYREWFAKQEEITKKLTESIKGQIINDKTPDFIKNLLASQEEFGKKWMDTMKDMSQNFSGEKVLDLYKEGTDQFFGAWKKAYDQFTGMFSTTFGLEKYDPATQAKEMHDKFVETAREYIQKMDEQVKSVTGK